jgi:uncharacterized membrane protein
MPKGLRIPPDRIEALTDAVFGLALTLTAIQLAFTPPTLVYQVLTNILDFAFSFGVLIVIWFAYTEIARAIRVEIPTILALNLTLLLLVTLEPYLLNILWIGIFEGRDPTILYFSAIAYTIDLSGMFLLLGFLGLRTAQQGSARPSVVSRLRLRRKGSLRVVVSIGFLATLVPVFWQFRFGIPGLSNGIGEPVHFHLVYVAWVALFVAATVGASMLRDDSGDSLAKGDVTPDEVAH